MPNIALCIPAYNASWCLPRLLTSARNQTIPFDEILVYDDCSTDNTSEIARQYGATVIKGDINRGQSAGKNRLAQISTSEWLHFHDADDDLLPNFTSLAHNRLNSGQSFDILLFDYDWVDGKTKILKGTRVFEEDKIKNDPIAYAMDNQINAICGLYSKEKYLHDGGYDVDRLILHNEEVAFHIKIALNGWRFEVEHTKSIINYYYADSFSQGNSLKCLSAHFEVMRRLVGHVDEKYNYIISKHLYSMAGAFAKCNMWQEATTAARLATRLSDGKPEQLSWRSYYFMRNFGLIGLVIREYTIRLSKLILK